MGACDVLLKLKRNIPWAIGASVSYYILKSMALSVQLAECSKLHWMHLNLARKKYKLRRFSRVKAMFFVDIIYT